MKTSTLSLLCSLGLLACVMLGCEPKVPSPTNPAVRVPLSVAEEQMKVKVASDAQKNARDAAVAKAKADAILDDAAAQVEIINQKAELSAKVDARPVVQQAKASASEIVNSTTAEIESRNTANAAAKAELESARAAYNAQMAALGGVVDFVEPVAKAGASGVGGPLGALLVPGIGALAWWLRGKQHKAVDATWDEAQADAEKKKKAEDAAWDQAQIAGQLQAALIALINKNNPPPPNGAAA